jgi:ABC-2 type transport system ATP-binding protein
MLLQFKNVKKQFNGKVVLKDVSFQIESGESIALIGPNGAGKTTIIRSIMGLINIDGGEIERNFDPRRDVGIMLQNDYFPENLKVKEVLELHKSYYNSTVDNSYLLSVAELEKEANSNVNSLSGGQKRRLSFAVALSVDPKLLFLDEPTVGMDVQSCKLFWSTIQDIQKKKKTILVTSHHLDELNEYCDRFLFIKDGEIIANIKKQDLTNQKVIVVVHDSREELEMLQRQFGGRIEDNKLYVTDMTCHESLSNLLKQKGFTFEERFKEVKDIYEEIYM